jgi:hypothetical protein
VEEVLVVGVEMVVTMELVEVEVDVVLLLVELEEMVELVYAY